MKCLRCGYCCKQYTVVIIIDPARGIALNNARLLNGSIEGPRHACPHLIGSEAGRYACALHDQPWYGETPCSDFGQVEENEDMPCRMGEHMMSLSPEERRATYDGIEKE